MDSPKRNNVKLLAAVIGGSAVMAMGALSVAVAQEQLGPGVRGQVVNDDHRLDNHRDDATDGGGHVDGRAGDEGPGAAAIRGAGAAVAVANPYRFHG